ncbi:MAG TPA: LuxR C-terminal-related transcriptional regulator [Chloroflexota bacterium]|jgi:DNA-binding NarL/FixJ family response regulator
MANTIETSRAGGSAASRAAFATLSRRECEVARLVVMGLSNRQIAERLVLADGTVQRHIANILHKLELASRVELAAWVVRQHGLAPPRAESAASPGLSVREAQVAGLVALGLRNRGIATRLAVAEATIQRHVAHILLKLGFSSRTQIAAWLAATPGELAH